MKNRLRIGALLSTLCIAFATAPATYATNKNMIDYTYHGTSISPHIQDKCNEFTATNPKYNTETKEFSFITKNNRKITLNPFVNNQSVTQINAVQPSTITATFEKEKITLSIARTRTKKLKLHACKVFFTPNLSYEYRFTGTPIKQH